MDVMQLAAFVISDTEHSYQSLVSLGVYMVDIKSQLYPLFINCRSIKSTFISAGKL